MTFIKWDSLAVDCMWSGRLVKAWVKHRKRINRKKIGSSQRKRD